MDFTARMAALLGRMRRERNGAAADALRFYGRKYGLNYGVSLPTLRQIARAETPDHDFARYLYLQDVRELRLAALHLAEPARLTEAEFASWASGIVNSELAEEAAFALLSRSERFAELFGQWIVSDNPLLAYAALLGAARSGQLCDEWIAPASEVFRRAGALENPGAAKIGTPPVQLPTTSTPDSFAPQLLARGVVAMFAALAGHNEQSRQAVCCAAGSLGCSRAADFVREELAWRLEV